MKSLAVKLAERGACSEAVAWVQSHKGTPQELWDQCQRGDWMLWILGKLSGEPESAKRKQLVRAACGCARLALKFVDKGEDRPRACIETTEAWANGKATMGQIEEAQSAARNYTADTAYYATAAVDAAQAATRAACATAVDGADAPKKILADCANVVRKFFPKAPRL